VTITTQGRPVLIHAQVRKHRPGSCVRGEVTVKLNGTLQLDPGGIGMATDYECSPFTMLNAMLDLSAGTHQIELMVKGNNAGACTYGTFDFLYVYELPN
jgi:hypothetical protein